VKELKNLRKEIDAIDDEIIKLLEKRFELISLIKKIKSENNLEVFDQERENEILNKISNANTKELYQELLRISKKIQKD
jgi:monofunctional chorismate mutase